MTGYAVNLDFWDRIQPKIRSWEIAHGRSMPKNQYQALVEGELSVATSAAAARAERGRALDLEQERMDLAKEQAEDAKSAAKVKGITDIGTTAGMGYLAYKQVGVNERIAKSYELMAGKEGAKPAVDLGAGKFTAPTAEKAGYTTLGTTPSTTAAVDLGTTTFAAPTATEAGYGLGGQAALTETAPILSTNTSFAASAAETEAIASGTTAATGSETAAAGTTAGPSALGTTAVGVGAGFAAKYLAEKAGANQEWSNVAGGAVSGAYIGSQIGSIGGPVGMVIGAVVGLVAGEIFDSVICSELLRQNEISKWDREWCVVFKHRYIDGRMFAAYLEWASPHVSAMRRGGWRNSVRLPFAHAFVNYMIKTAKQQKPTWFEKAVYAYCWKQCEKIADRVSVEMEVFNHA